MQKALPAPGALSPLTSRRKYREWEVYLRFFRYVLPYRRKILLSILTIFVGVPITQFGRFVDRYLVDEVILNVADPVAARLTLFWIIMAAQVAIWVVGRMLLMLRQVLGWYVDMRVTITLRKQFYSHLQQLSLQFHRSRPVGEHMYRSTADVGGGAVRMITTFGPELIEIVYSMLWAAGLLVFVDYRLTLLVLLYVIPYVAGAQYFYGRRQDVLRALRTEQQALMAALRDGIAGSKTVKSFGRIALQTRTYVAQIIRAQRMQIADFMIDLAGRWGILWAIQMVLKWGMWFYLAAQTVHGALSYGEFAVVLALSRDFETQMERIVLALQQVRLDLVPAERMLETLDVEPEIRDVPNAPVMPPIRGRLEFRAVGLVFPDGTTALREVSFVLEPGTYAAVVGPSGSGKTSLCSLLLRHHDPTTGVVMIDGRDVRSVRLNSVLKQLGVVPQEAFLFGGTVADNIRYGRPEADDEAVRAAARGAGLTEFLEELPDGLETELGEGTKLSGGQRQRLGIARALVREPRVLILDGPTASLDVRTEELVMRTFREVRRGRTTLMVANRLVTVADADVVFVMDGGELVERGTHAELLAHGGLYARMWREQTEA
jgi:ABC-type multidrug transport system fused ATPase/permease subunit